MSLVQKKKSVHFTCPLVENKQIVLQIKPLSVNQAWCGKRFKTEEYKQYEKDCFTLLPKEIFIPDGKLKLIIQIQLSSKNADIDNILKPFIDILQKKYIFNDKRIYRIEIEKIDVSKGFESIIFKFENLK